MGREHLGYRGAVWVAVVECCFWLLVVARAVVGRVVVGRGAVGESLCCRTADEAGQGLETGKTLLPYRLVAGQALLVG